MIDRFERFTYSVFELARLWHKIASEEFGKYGLKYGGYYSGAYYRGVKNRCMSEN